MSPSLRDAAKSGSGILIAGCVLFGIVSSTIVHAAADSVPDNGNLRPNIVFILADDLGYGDLGLTNQNGRGPSQAKFATPHLDSLANRGMLFRQHYTAAPDNAAARASLLLGQNQGDCPLRDDPADEAVPNNHTLGTVLKAAGYHTIAIGAWGLSGVAPGYAGHPLKHGFDEFFGTLSLDSGHAYNPDAAHPLHDGNTDVTQTFLNVYGTDLYTARAKKFLIDHQANHSDQPFFMYLAYAAPHFPQGLPGGAYPHGGGLNGGVQWPVPAVPETRDAWLNPDYRDATYEPSPGRRVPWTPRMKRYATVIGRLDDGVGDLVQTLRDLDLEKNTLVVFTSDNGPANEGIDPRSFGSSGPFDGLKRDVLEGGLRVPAIACWPGHIAGGLTSDNVSQFADWMPTLTDFGRLIAPAVTDGVSLKPTLLELPGQRDRGFYYTEYFCPTPARLHGPLAEVLSRKHATGLGQQQMLRVGDFVGLRMNIQKADDPLHLYDVITDPHEDQDLSQDPDYGGVAQRFRLMIRSVRRPEPGVPRPYDEVPLPGVFTSGTEGAIKVDTFAGDWPWVPDLNAIRPVHTSVARGFDLASPGSPDDPFAVKFTGSIVVPTTGSYTFWITTDTGAELWLHEVHVIDDDFNHNGAAVQAEVNLAAGAHPFRLFYRHKFGTPSLSLEYAGPSIARQPVPVSELRMPE